MGLAGRKQIVLAAVVEHYLRTGEPVGSKAVLEHGSLNVSSATIRNDMAALEREGYLEQPHTSAGRIPTVAGCRYYIEHLMQPYVLSPREREEIDCRLDQGDGANAETVVQNAADALSEITQLAVVNASNLPRFTVISQVEVIPAGKRLYALLMITSSGDIKNRMCRLSVDLTQEQLTFFENFLRENLVGQSPRDLNPAQRQKLAVAMGSYMLSLSPLLHAVYELSEQFYRQNINISGEGKLLLRPGFDSSGLVRFLEEKNQLAQLLGGAFGGVQVIFGKEDSPFAVSNSSLLLAPYQMGSHPGGSLGIIGPVRLDYLKLIPYTEYFSQSLSRQLGQFVEEEHKEGRSDDGE